MAPGRDHRPRGLGPRPRGEVPRPAGRQTITWRPPPKPGEWRVVASSLDRVPFQADAKPADDEPVVLTSELAAQRAELRARQADLRARLGQLGTTMPDLCRHLFPTRPDPRAPPGRPDAAGRPRCAPSAVAAVGTPLVLPADAPERDRRLALARWIGDPDQSAAGAGDGQPGLALPFRPGHRRHAQRLRLQRRPAVAPRAARLAGLRGTWPAAGGSSRCTG